MLFANKVTNNKTEDTLYIYSGTVSNADSLVDLVVNKHLTRLDALDVRSLEAGKNVSFIEASDLMASKFALIYKLNSGEYESKINISLEELGLILLHRTNICKRGATIFKMEDCKQCKEAVDIYDDMIEEAKIKNYMSISQFAELIGVNAQTLRNWDKSDKLKPALVSKDGRRMYTFNQSLEYLGEKRDTRNIGIGYVVKRENTQEIETIIKKYFKTIGCEDYTIMEDAEYGINDRVTFQDVLRKVISGRVSHLVLVEKNMALPLSSLELLELTLKICGCKLHRVY